jgi:hypothetical protein
VTGRVAGRCSELNANGAASQDVIDAVEFEAPSLLAGQAQPLSLRHGESRRLRRARRGACKSSGPGVVAVPDATSAFLRSGSARSISRACGAPVLGWEGDLLQAGEAGADPRAAAGWYSSRTLVDSGSCPWPSAIDGARRAVTGRL